jgi:rod shape-determining protein MreC
MRISNISDYFSLHGENRKLAQENAMLYNNLRESYTLVRTDSGISADAQGRRKYYFLTARVINNTVNKQYNFLTLDRGSEEGIHPDMAVASTEGIVGIVKSVSRNYASVLSLLNLDFNVSAKIKKNGYFGPLSWNGSSANFATLVDIPHHVKFSDGDTIVTSGFGGVFPEGLLIGTIENFKLKGGNYYEIKVKLSNDFRKLNYVKVIHNISKNEIDSLENAVRQ